MTADTFSSSLGVLLMGTGNDNNAWGNNCNGSVFQVFEDAIANALTLAVTGGTLDLSGSPPPAAPSQVRYAALVFTGTLTADQIVQVPDLPKFWWVQNATSGAFTLTMKTPTGTAPVSIPQNAGWQRVQSDGAGNILISPFNTNQILMPDGPVGAPAYSNVNEPNSGWRREGTQDWRFAVAGKDILQVTGPGATTPSVVNVLSGSLQIGGVQVVPAGTEISGAFIELPAGYLWEDGAAISRPMGNGGTVDTFKALFGAITATATANTNGTTALTNLSRDLRGMGLDGAKVEGTGIPSGTTITFTAATTATLSQAAVGTNTKVALRIFPYGNGDGASTFNVPDRRYRVLVGRDDLNNNPANRSSLFAGKSLSTTGGAEGLTIVQANLPKDITFTVTIPAGQGSHGHTTNAAPQNNGQLYANGQGNNGLVHFQGFNASADGAVLPAMTGTAATGGTGTTPSNMQPFGITNCAIKF